MNKYLVTATQIINYEIEIEAENEDAAMREAEKVSDNTLDEFIEVGFEFTVDEAEEIN
jgi:hypothetical protein